MNVNFTLRQLEYAVAVARHLNFGAAAAACHVSQPSLSTQIGHLETLLGELLFERTSRGVLVTPFGENFVERAQEILARATALESLARSQREPLTGQLRLGVIPTVAPFVLPAAMAALRTDHPRARVYLVEDQTDHLRRRLLDGELDCLLLALEAELAPLDTLAVFRDPFVVALPTTHPLAARDAIALEDIPRDELLLLEEGHCLSRQVEDVCALANESPRGDFRASSLVTLVHMVAAGMGVTLLPRVAEAADIARTEGIVLRPLSDEAFRTIGLAWRPGCPRAAEFEVLAGVIEAAAPAC